MDDEKVDLKVKNFTVSYSFESYKGGLKTSHFVSMTFESSQLLDPSDAVYVQTFANEHVTKSTIYDALVRGNITVDEANEMIQNLKNNSEYLRKKLIKKTDKV
jgi:hypothetical protein